MENEKKNLYHDVLEIFIANHRGFKSNLCLNGDHHGCFQSHEEKIKKYIDNNQKIQFILPAFPAKSPNKNKTMSSYPDLGEKMALAFLNAICEKIFTLYTEGAEVIICSDGRVFNDLVHVSDETVDQYQNAIKKIIKENNFNHLKTFNLDECEELVKDNHYIALRENLLKIYGEETTIIRERVKHNLEAKLLFNGMHRFIYEDRIVMKSNQSKNKIRDESKEITYQLIRRSNAWGMLLKEKYKEAVRLSIHPQLCRSEKLGILLLPSDNVWATPWHRVLLKQDQQYKLIKNEDALKLKATPVYEAEAFSHYELESLC